MQVLFDDTEDKQPNITCTNMDITGLLHGSQICGKWPSGPQTCCLWDSDFGAVFSCASACTVTAHCCAVVVTSVGRYCCIQKPIGHVRTKAAKHTRMCIVDLTSSKHLSCNKSVVICVTAGCIAGDQETVSGELNCDVCWVSHLSIYYWISN